MVSKIPVIVEDEMDDIDFDGEFGGETESASDLVDVNLGDGHGVLIYNDKKFAVGLIWLTISELEGDDSVYKKAQAIGGDFYCTRTFVGQSGFGSLNKDHRIGMASAAVMAADTLIGEWHGVFRADNGWLYVAVHSDSIAPDGDRFFEDEKQCYNHFLKESEKFKWPKSYVPAAWNFPQNDGEIPLEQILDAPVVSSLKPANLDALFSGKANKNIAIFSVLILLGFIILSVSSQSFIANFLPEPEDVPFTPTNISSNLMSPPKITAMGEDPVENLLNDTQIINIGAVLGTCINTFDSLMVSVPGWNLTSMRCRGNFADAIWKKSAGTLDSLRDNVDQFSNSVVKTYSANGDFIASSVMQFSDESKEQLKLSKRENVIILLNQRFSGISDLIVQDVPTEAPATQQSGSTSIIPVITLQNLPRLKVIMKTDVSPLEMIDRFDISGLTLNLIEWDTINGEWLYDMNIYLYPENYKN